MQSMTTTLLSRASTAAGLIAFLAVAIPSEGLAHEQDHFVGGDKLKMSQKLGRPGTGKLQFKTKDQLSLFNVDGDPSDPAVVTTLIVRGTGPTDGSSGVIVLDPAGWRQSGNGGWKYKADAKLVSSGGVSQISIKPSNTGGSMKIKAKGDYWDYDLAMAQQAVQVQLAIDGDLYCAEFSSFKKNLGGKVQAADALPPAGCDSVCGNGILQLSEQCDDGNTENEDTCDNSCVGCSTQVGDFTSTFEGIQDLIFDSPLYDCTNEACHGSATQGGLDLRAGASHASLIDVPSQIDPGTVRVFPGDQDLSMLYNKIAAKTLGSPAVPGTEMPSNPQTVSTELLEALRLWIRGGAQETGVVEGTSALFGACLPAPDPLKIPQPDPPALGTGVQIAMPGWDLPSQSEDEICVTSFYDFDDLSIVPAEFRIPCPGAFAGTNPSGECFAYSDTRLAQDPQSHHSIIHIYAGDYDWDDDGWGDWTCYEGANDGLPCDPRATPTQCPDGVCGGATRTGVACLAFNPRFGPPDYGLLNNNAPTFGGAQESTNVTNYPAGVYALLPLRGVIVWNSHAFNLTGEDMNMEAWVNLELTNDQQFFAAGLFNDNYIFTQDVDPYETEEYCATHTFAEGTRLFDLNSHTHKRGKRFRYYQAPQTPCGNGGTSPVGNGLSTDPACVPGDPADLFYESFDYSDALNVQFDPPLHYTGSVEDRTIKFCGLFDNGSVDPGEVKLASTSPCGPNGCFNPLVPGGPCPANERKCVGGANAGQLCPGGDGDCPGSTCDACNARGGVTTEDEMFIATGTFYIDP